MKIFELFGSVFVDSDPANKSLDKTDKNAKGLGKTFGKMGKMAGVAGKLIGGAALAGGAAMVALAKKTGDAADRLLDLSSITGMSTDEIQKWEKVTTVAGVSADAITNASQKLTRQMDILSTGTGKAAEAAEALGLSYEVLETMTPDERMNALVESLQKVEDPAERAKLGTDLLAGSWKDIAPVLDVGAKRLKGIKDNANIISNDDLNQANEFRIKIDQMKERVIEFGQGLAVKLIPYLNKFFDWIASQMPLIEAVFKEVFENISIAISFLIPILRDTLIPIFVTLFNWVVDNMPLFKEIAINTFNAIVIAANALWTFFKEYILPILQSLWDLWIKISPAIKDLAGKAFDGIVIAAKALWGFFSNNILPIIQDLYDLILDLIPKLEPIFKTVFENIGKSIDLVVGIVKNFIGWVDKAITAAKNFFSVKDDAEGRQSGSTSSGGFGLGGFNIPGLANGGTVTRGGRVLVGENAPEILDLPRGATVTPLGAGRGVNISLNNSIITDDYGVDQLMDRIVGRMSELGVI